MTSPACTIVDIAPALTRQELEGAINEADKLDLVDPEALRAYADSPRRRGAASVRALLDASTFALTDSELERLFIPIALRAGLPKPLTQHEISGYRVDFYWPDLKLVVETDGLRYHRTSAQQKRDRERDQILTAAGLTVLRFTYAQVRHESAHVERTLATVAARAA